MLSVSLCPWVRHVAGRAYFSVAASRGSRYRHRHLPAQAPGGSHGCRTASPGYQLPARHFPTAAAVSALCTGPGNACLALNLIIGQAHPDLAGPGGPGDIMGALWLPSLLKMASNDLRKTNETSHRDSLPPC